MTILEQILTYFNKEDAQAVKTQVQSRMDSSQQKLLANLLEAASEKAYKEGRDTYENELVLEDIAALEKKK